MTQEKTMQTAKSPWPAEAAAKHDELKFRRLMAVLPAAAYTCDAEGLITYFNQRAVEVWGRAPKLNDPVDRFCGSFKLFAPDGSPIRHDCCWMALALQENQEYNGREIVVERPDGERRTVLAHANPFRDERGNLTGAVNVLVDITDRKRAEDALREADRRKDEFLGILAHELRNPLAPLRNALEILKLDASKPSTLEQVRAMMERQLEQMVRLVDDLMDTSRIATGKLALRKERIELAAVLQSAVEEARPLIERHRHELALSFPPRPIHLNGDFTRLAQVFSNLLTNAAKYMEPGGRIQLSAEGQGRDVVVKVRDAGTGISADMLDKIFEPFVQADHSLERTHGGLGIGLSLVRRLAEMHGGSVKAYSDGPGHGSEFTVRLPVLDESGPREMQAGDKPGSTRAASRYRILVVDGNRDAAMRLAALLKVMGHETRTAHDGLAAVTLAEEFGPDVALLDLGLPRLGGHATARMIRERAWGRAMWLIALTESEDPRHPAEAEFNLRMVKPVDPTALEHLLAGIDRNVS
jgi:PAS domain S-box-containing protein